MVEMKWTQCNMVLAFNCNVSAVQRLEHMQVFPSHQTILEALRKLAAESGVEVDF